MIQKLAKDKCEKELLVVSNKSATESIRKLKQAEKWNSIDEDSELHFFENIKSLRCYLLLQGNNFNGTIIFMFFDGTEFIQNTIEELIELESKQDRIPFLYSTYLAIQKKGQNVINMNMNMNMVLDMSQPSHRVKIYVDESVYNSGQLNASIENFCELAAVSSLLIKKLQSVGRCFNVYIDDQKMSGPREQSVRCLLRNFPEVDFRFSRKVSL